MRKIKSLLNKMSSPRNVVGDLRLTKSFVSKVFSLVITTQSAEDFRQRRSGMTALLDVKAFTLVELLVVVLIIGILSAVAIPMYQGAVDKSHWSTMLPASKAIKDAEETFKMTNGEYSNTMEHLDVQMNNSDLTFTLSTPNTLADPNVIRVTNSKLDNVRLASYLDDSPMFAGQLHCEAKNEGSAPNERGQRLCEKLLNGQYLKTTDDGYTRYLLDQAVDKATCGAAEGSWSTSKNKCYNNTSERCTDLGLSQIAGRDMCGKENGTKWGGSYGPESTCLSTSGEYVCTEITLNGGACIDVAGGRNCRSMTVDNGGICVANKTGSYGWGGCTGSFKNGSICYANVGNACGNHWQDTSTSYDETSCCCGAYCGDAPSCASRGKTCDPYYMDKSNFLDE